jgi:hypothetical protein
MPELGKIGMKTLSNGILSSVGNGLYGVFKDVSDEFIKPLEKPIYGPLLESIDKTGKKELSFFEILTKFFTDLKDSFTNSIMNLSIDDLTTLTAFDSANMGGPAIEGAVKELSNESGKGSPDFLKNKEPEKGSINTINTVTSNTGNNTTGGNFGNRPIHADLQVATPWMILTNSNQ